MDDGRMGPKAYAAFEKQFMLFGSLAKSFAPGVPIEEWEKYANQFLKWSQAKAKELCDAAYNGHAPKEEDPPPPAEEKEEGPVINQGQAKRFYALGYNEGGYTQEGIKRLLKKHGLSSGYKIPVKQYTAMCALAQNPTLAADFNKGV